tara:strand:- start:257 stop:490 length:234 start_codon:yes stop_codon:yes gene_type:complete
VEVVEVEIFTLQVEDLVKQVVQVVEQVNQKMLQTQHQEDLIQEEQVYVVKGTLVVILLQVLKTQVQVVEENQVLEHQ